MEGGDPYSPGVGIGVGIASGIGIDPPFDDEVGARRQSPWLARCRYRTRPRSTSRTRQQRGRWPVLPAAPRLNVTGGSLTFIDEVRCDHKGASRGGEDGIFVSHVVLGEMCWVLSAVYGFGKREIVAAIRALLDDSTFALEERASVETALARHEESAGQFSDHLIGIIGSRVGADTTYTLDRRAANSNAAARSACVYGSRGAANTVSAGPCSTIRPARMTSTW